RQVARALQHAHEKGLIHRDIKPQNLLRANQGHVIKLLDLGLARLQKNKTRLANARQGLTQIGIILGTLDFIAPEQARDSHSVDIRADLYSLGCTFHFLLTGKPPYPGGTPTEKLLKHTLDPLPPLEHLPQGVTAVIHKLIAKNPEDRYQTPGEVAAALDDLLSSSGEVLLARPADAPPQMMPMLNLPPVAAPVTVPVARPVQPAGIADVVPKARLAPEGPPAPKFNGARPSQEPPAKVPTTETRPLPQAIVPEALAPVAPSQVLPQASPATPEPEPLTFARVAPVRAARPKWRLPLTVALGLLVAGRALSARVALAVTGAAPPPPPH